jgi:ribonuclease P protein component
VLAAAHRLRRRADFAATIRGGRRVARGALVVHLAVGPPMDGSVRNVADRVRTGQSGPWAGFVVSRAVGGAVVRNLVKRRLRDLVGQRLDQLPDGTTLVVRALPTAASRHYADLAADLDAALAGALPGTPNKSRP